MIRRFYPILFFLFLFNIVVAQELSIDSSSIALPTFENTKKNLTMINLTLNLSGVKAVKIESISIKLNTTSNKNANETNLVVCVFNSSSSLINCSSNWKGNETNITFSNLVITNDTVTNLLIVAQLNENLFTPLNFSILLENNDSIALNDSGVIITGNFPISSEFIEVHDLHANGEIRPRFVDTNVVKQKFIVIINKTGDESFDRVHILLPSILNLSNVTLYEWGTGQDSCSSPGCVFSGNEINITRSGTNYLKITFLATTINTTSVGSIEAKIYNSYLSDVDVDEKTTGSFNVTIKNLLQIIDQNVMKGAAIINGSDYWLFNITFNLTAPVNGTFQFKMSNWTRWSNSSFSIPLVSNNYYYAWFGKNLTTIKAQGVSNSSTSNDRTFITNTYGQETHGLSFSYSESPFTIFVKMIIPNNSSYCCYSDWFAQFWALFRATP